MQNTLLIVQLGQSDFYIPNGQAMTEAHNTKQKSNRVIKDKKTYIFKLFNTR